MRTTTLPFALNRSGDFKLPEDGWIQLAPYGEIEAPLVSDGAKEVKIVQVLNHAVADGLVERFNRETASPNFPGLLVDYDHFSHDTEKSSRAAGWIEEVAARDTGLWGKVRFTAGGKSALEGGDYRLFSPVFGFPARDYQPRERVSPAALLRGALTNDPRFKGMLPISNRQDGPAVGQPKNMDYKSVLISLLGLAAAATDAEIQAAAEGKKSETENRKSDLAAVQNRAAAAEARATQAEAALLEHDLDAAGLQGDARSAAKVILSKNRAEGLAFLKAMKPAEGDGSYQVTHNRSAAKAPPAGDARATTTNREAAVREYMSVNRCDFETAWNSVRAAKPDLFKE